VAYLNIGPKEVYDAIVVGSGATGGWAAKELAEAGLRVAVLEAGRMLVPEKDFTEHGIAYQVRYRGYSPEIAKTRPVQGHCSGCNEWNYKWFVNDFKNPYITAIDKPVWWFRLRILGGRSLAWGRQSYRLSDLDLKAASHDGYGEDWPISYADLAPWYDKVEQYVGVSGAAEGVTQLPDGKFLPPMPMTCGELRLRKAARKEFGRIVTIGRCANLTVPLNGRAPCHYCGPCERGCITHSYYNSPTTTLAAAQSTDRLTLITDAVVSHVTTDTKTGRATGVRYINRLTRETREVRSKVVVLCAQAMESVRVLLNSTTRQFPNGLANSSGVLGHYLMDHVTGFGAHGVMPMLESRPWAGPPRRPNGIYVIRFRNVTERAPNFIRGYGFQGGSNPQFNFEAEGFGKQFKESVKQGEWTIGLGAFGECLARWDNYIELDNETVDAWGIPALRIHASHGENEEKLGDDAANTAAEMLEAAGAKNIRQIRSMEPFGNAIHEVGVARMGNDARKSVLNSFCQAHDVRNLFIMDGSSWVSSGCQNPTLGFMAMACRSCAFLVDKYRKGEV
jgi:glucoside 3-dehydrogenase (cytochrome c) catalytic subunit